ncbi:MAG: peptidoglycan DD-metalloendopeptidase family protein, partial [Bacillota bacterium]|nr:peptidoglycan DD-metalloendopeptidase family protein [Bacillota bacterium]
SESFIHRTIRLFKGLAEVRHKVQSSDMPYTHEKKTRLIKAVFEDAWEPITSFFEGLVEDFWNFLVTIWEDFVEIILFFVNVLITIWYYISSFLIFIWDIIWDIRIALESKKREVFQYFAASISIIAIVLIFLSSLSAYEYSYYGRKLGITRSKQEVYQTIDALGDKLSEASGANVNIDVERDIKFSRVFGFNLNVDTEEDILNTLTYMKDIQVRAYAINIDSKRTVILENEEVANNVLQRIRTDYAPETQGVVYTSVIYDQVIETEEVGVLLGDIWNPSDAIKYLKTGSTKQVDESEITPLITMRTVETATYDTDIKFGAKYIDNSELYLGETELISAGVYGKNEVVAEVTRVNGKEVKRVIQSTTKTKNPVDAVYYSGTKPIPEKKGTGTFIWPVKNTTRSMLTSRFGSRNTGIIGASTYHEGLDIGVATGTKIYACDGGVVTFAGWRAGYGYVVIIDHGGLFETRYGHCSKLLVSEGEKVFQGQNIALAGSTGVSSGPHCHLEIRYNGTAKNPIDYLPSLN